MNLEKNINEINDFKKDVRKNGVCDTLRKNGLLLKYVENPTTIMIITAIKNNPEAINFVKNPTNEMIFEALSQDFFEIKENLFNLFEKLPQELKELAIAKNGLLIKYINNPSFELKNSAIKSNGWSALFIEDLSEDMKLDAIHFALDYFIIDGIHYYQEEISTMLGEQTRRMIAALSVEEDMKHMSCMPMMSVFSQIKTREENLLEFYMNKSDLEYIENPSKEIQMKFVKEDINAIRHIHNPCEEVLEYVINKNPKYIKSIKNPSQKLKDIVIKKKPKILLEEKFENVGFDENETSKAWKKEEIKSHLVFILEMVALIILLKLF